MILITGRASSFLEFFLFLKTQSQSKLNPNQVQNQMHSFFALLSFSVSRANLSCVVATIFSSLNFPVSMANLSRLVAASFSSFALLSSSVSMAKLSCLLATTFSSLTHLSNSFSSPLPFLCLMLSLSFLCFSVSEALFALSLSFLSERLLLFFVHAKAALAYSRNQ